MVHLQEAQGLSFGDADAPVTARDVIEDEATQGAEFGGQYHVLVQHLHGAQPFVQLVSHNLKGWSIAALLILHMMIWTKDNR